MRKPNFLLFITDQHRADWLGCYGHPVVKTPNIDALAARGTRFDDFHVALPVCMPNRASLLTGRYPSVHGLRHNGCVLSERANTFVDVLAAGAAGIAVITSILDAADPEAAARRLKQAMLQAWPGDSPVVQGETRGGSRVG